MSSLPAQRGWKGEGDAGAPRPGLAQAKPAARCPLPIAPERGWRSGGT